MESGAESLKAIRQTGSGARKHSQIAQMLSRRHGDWILANGTEEMGVPWKRRWEFARRWAGAGWGRRARGRRQKARKANAVGTGRPRRGCPEPRT